MSKEDLIKKIKDAVKHSGYLFEQKIGHLLEANGWIPFYSVNYVEPIFNVERELDILAYKIINQRRIELRISCKQSKSKPWIFFTENTDRYIKHASDLI